MKEFLVTILGEAKEQQFPHDEPAGRVWKLPEESLRMLKKSFQRAKGDLSNSPPRCDNHIKGTSLEYEEGLSWYA